MDFVANRRKQTYEMLAAMGIASVDELFRSVPEKLLLERPAVEDGLSEYEALRHCELLAAKNTHLQFDSYLGAGAYEHHVPALAVAICQKSEFLTSYTPYQPESSQGVLQALFEFQSCLSALTQLQVANASVYDGASACAEALLMALRTRRGRQRVAVARGLHPHYRRVVETYLEPQRVEIVEQVDSSCAACLVQSPNFFGAIEDVAAAAEEAHSAGALAILCANPLSLALFKSPGELGVDIAVGDMQPLGIPLQLGGPYCGYIACREELVRQLPGRLVGQTVDGAGRTAYVLTLQAREQHIRRAKATSNICTSQVLCALASLVTMLWYGPEGLRQLALTNYQRCEFLKRRLAQLPGIETGAAPTFNEFVLKAPVDLVGPLKKRGILAGVPLALEGEGGLLVAVTETKSADQLEHYVRAVREAVA